MRALAVGLLVALLRELGVSGPVAALGALVAAVSTSIWMDASLAEVHTLTLVFTIATLLFALRFGRTGQRRDLLWLTLVFSQGVAHQRAVGFLLPAVAVLIVHQWRVIWRGLLPAMALCLLAPLTYLYLPWRVSQGATWVFGSPGTWQRVMAMLLDNRAERIVAWPGSAVEWIGRIGQAFEVVAIDVPAVLMALGLLALFVLLLQRRWREFVGLTLAWVPYLVLTAVIWIGRVGDAQLAAHLPITLLVAAGLALLAESLSRQVEWGRPVAAVALAGVVAFLCVRNRPAVLEVTRDPSAEVVIATAEQTVPIAAEEPATFMALWGNDFWALAYAQAFEGRLQGLDIVDHNADFESILARGNRLFTFSWTFYLRPVSWWEGHVGRVYLTSVALDVVEVGAETPLAPGDVPPGPDLDLGNEIVIRSAQLSPTEDGDLVLTVYWQAENPTPLDYSVAVHLVDQDPPLGPEDVLSQADRSHPVYGWYPTSRWQAGELVRDHYRVEVPGDVQPRAVRVSLYRLDAAGNFVNSPWLSLPVED